MPNNFPIPEARAIAKAPQNVTQTVARRTLAPPACAPIAPSRARKPRDSVDTARALQQSDLHSNRPLPSEADRKREPRSKKLLSIQQLHLLHPTLQRHLARPGHIDMTRGLLTVGRAGLNDQQESLARLGGPLLPSASNAKYGVRGRKYKSGFYSTRSTANNENQ